MKTISSRQNAWFKRVRDAIREHADEIVIEGPKAVADARAAGWTPIAVITRSVIPSPVRDPEAQGAAPEGLGIPRELGMTPEIFDALAETKTPQSVIGLFERPRATLAAITARKDTIAVALDGVQDPGNVGTIVRLAAAFDAAGVVLLPGCADAFSPKAIRASVGAILGVPVVRATAQELIATGLPLYAADAAGSTDAPPARNAVLVFGSEGAGVSEEIRRAATPIAVAMSPRVESLNVAASAAILLSQSFVSRRA